MRIVTVGKPVQFRGVFVGFAALLVLAATAFGTNTATADSVQVQSYQRASATEACVAQPGETPWQASWGPDSSWTPSWEQWANGGNGGWTCTRSITWATTPAPVPSSVTYRVGDIGPGGGLVFYIDSVSGLRYEMAPNTWGAGEQGLRWCYNSPSSSYPVPGATETAVGTGKSNTAAMAASGTCNSEAAAAVIAYGGTDSSAGQWFLPSRDELYAMCYFSLYLTAAPNPTIECFNATSGAVQNPAFNAAYKFTSAGPTTTLYWSSSQTFPDRAAGVEFFDGWLWEGCGKNGLLKVRPIRAF